MDIAREHLAYQEYATILDDLDKQVEQAYLKRTRSIKAKKKRVIGEPKLAKGTIGEGIKTLMERRRRWIDKISPIFAGMERRIPRESVFRDLDGLREQLEKEAKADEELVA